MSFMLYKVWAESNFDSMWCYHNFKETIKGTIYSYDIEDNAIRSVTYLVNNPIPQELFDQYFFAFEIIKN